MTASHTVSCSWTRPTAGRGRLEIDGDLDYDGADLVLDEVVTRLAANPDLRELTLDCRRVGFCDSYGLSTLLMIRRRTQAAGVVLHLADRSPSLDRLLQVTNTLRHLTEPSAGSQERHLDP